MNQTNNVYTLRSEEPMIASNQYIISHVTTHSSQSPIHYVLHPSPQPSAQMLTPITGLYAPNASPNSLVLLTNSSAHDMNENLKCCHCGQISSSPISQCHHCKQLNLRNRNGIIATIAAPKFYKSQTNSGVRIGNRARMQMSSSSMMTPNRPVISNIRSLSSPQNCSVFTSNQRLHQINPQLIKKQSKNPELIELDAENAEKTPQHISQESSDECIEIMDTNNTEDTVGIGVQCDINSDSKSQSNDPIFNESVNNIDINQNNNNNNINDIHENKTEVDLNSSAFPDYVMFGTYRTDAKMVEFISDGIKLTNVTPNNKETKFKYHIMIPFVEMQELFHCCDSNLLFLKPDH